MKMQDPLTTSDEHGETSLAKARIHSRIEDVKRQALFKTTLFTVALSLVVFLA
jgi:hypothetical protein